MTNCITGSRSISSNRGSPCQYEPLLAVSRTTQLWRGISTTASPSQYRPVHSQPHTSTHVNCATLYHCSHKDNLITGECKRKSAAVLLQARKSGGVLPRQTAQRFHNRSSAAMLLRRPQLSQYYDSEGKIRIARHCVCLRRRTVAQTKDLEHRARNGTVRRSEWESSSDDAFCRRQGYALRSCLCSRSFCPRALWTAPLRTGSCRCGPKLSAAASVRRRLILLLPTSR